MLKIIYKEYSIQVNKDHCTVRQSFKNKNLVTKKRLIGHYKDVPTAIEKIATHELHSNNNTIELKRYLKEYRETVDSFWALIK